MRANLYIKVEVDYDDDDETAERLAAQICKQAMKVYGVRSAELSSVSVQDE